MPCDGNLGLSLSEVAEADRGGSWMLVVVAWKTMGKPWESGKISGKPGESHGKTMNIIGKPWGNGELLWKDPAWMGKLSISTGPFSITMLNYQLKGIDGCFAMTKHSYVNLLWMAAISCSVTARIPMKRDKQWDYDGMFSIHQLVIWIVIQHRQ